MGLVQSYLDEYYQDDDQYYPDELYKKPYPSPYQKSPYQPYQQPPYNPYYKSSPYGQPSYNPYYKSSYHPYKQPFYKQCSQPSYVKSVQPTYQQICQQCVPTTRIHYPEVSTYHSSISLPRTVYHSSISLPRTVYHSSSLPRTVYHSSVSLPRSGFPGSSCGTHCHCSGCPFLDVSALRRVCNSSCDTLCHQDKVTKKCSPMKNVESTRRGWDSVMQRESTSYDDETESSRVGSPLKITIVDQRPITNSVQVPRTGTFLSGQTQFHYPYGTEEGTYADFSWPMRPAIKRREGREYHRSNRRHSDYNRRSKSCSPTILEAINCQEKMVTETRKLRKIIESMLEQTETMQGRRYTDSRNARPTRPLAI